MRGLRGALVFLPPRSIFKVCASVVIGLVPCFLFVSIHTFTRYCLPCQQVSASWVLASVFSDMILTHPLVDRAPTMCTRGCVCVCVCVRAPVRLSVRVVVSCTRECTRECSRGPPECYSITKGQRLERRQTIGPKRVTSCPLVPPHGHLMVTSWSPHGRPECLSVVIYKRFDPYKLGDCASWSHIWRPPRPYRFF